MVKNDEINLEAQHLVNSKSKPIQKPTKKTRPTNKPPPSQIPSNAQMISLQDQPSRPRPSIRQFIYMPNVQFYLNKMSSSPNGQFIDVIHKDWWGNYILLQTNHSYIQWLFPNSYQSRFNQNAKPLTKQEAKHFRQNLNIATRYVRSYEMILEFFGMKLANRTTGEISRTIKPRYKDRYDETLLSAYHNHLRITRILCSLTEVGFAFYARELCKFLKKEIYEHNGRLIRLKHLDVYKHWRPFEGDNKERSNKIDVEDVANVYLRTLWKQQGYNPLVKERSKWHQIYTKNKPTIVLGDESESDDNGGKNEKNEAKQLPGTRKNEPSQRGKDQQKQEVSQLSLRQKVQYTTEPPPEQQQQFSMDSSELSQQVPEKQYGRRGTKQYQKLKKQLSTTEHGYQTQKILRQIRKQEQLEQKLQMKVKAYMRADGDNPIKTRMNELRKKYGEKLKEFSGPRHAETMEERENRMMQRGKQPINLEGEQSSEFDEDTETLRQ